MDEALSRDRRLEKWADAKEEFAGRRARRRPILDGYTAVPVDDPNRERDLVGLNIALLNLQRHCLRFRQGTVATGDGKREKGQGNR